jgi:lysophospholipid acyltransferase (LPLAT)-like uncharacterized protein
MNRKFFSRQNLLHNLGNKLFGMLTLAKDVVRSEDRECRAAVILAEGANVLLACEFSDPVRVYRPGLGVLTEWPAIAVAIDGNRTRENEVFDASPVALGQKVDCRVEIVSVVETRNVM